MNCSKLTEDRIPELGTEFISEEDAYKFYNKYAFKMGFSRRKDYLNKDKDGVTTYRRYSYCKESVKRKYEGDVSELESTSVSFDEYMFMGYRLSTDSVSERNNIYGLRLTIDINSTQLHVDE
ncbi:uncharacterized protein [Coffea arabica]|uniref:Protein FAR1-RELATED SEQUENCE n=1 Tax=Coffea arabica TaxID=13443 RepID=A0A6P6X4M8_COFAR|nr:uncharacterized protein LOC113739396 [Coffea arabica]XP_027122419.1 uncharacterized protein LOC113739406 [Coffea arabica]